MEAEGAKEDECFILVKAQPHRSSKYFETVCCAGIGRDGKWRRQYPVPYRILNDAQKFSRWNWIEYSYTKSKEDKRTESQKVVPESLVVTGKLNKNERARILNPLVRNSFSEANSLNESLTLIRPQKLLISWDKKSETDLNNERRKHAALANQLSLLDPTAEPLEPCPIQFYVEWKDSVGADRRHECDDWETSTAYKRFQRMYGETKALKIIKTKYEKEYFRAGLALAFSTHSRRNITYGMQNQWLLVGLVRLDIDTQRDLLL
ncbi:MAG: hypothetical protein HQ483_02260 [Rhodospirillales bacterium]|nr:hypothetical protein [Rhodospirillales bacterium]